MTSTVRVLFAVAALAGFRGAAGPHGRRRAAPARRARAAARTGDRHLPHAALEAELRALAAAHAGSATLVEMGRTAGGRRLWAIEIAAPGAAPPASRPGILLVANLAADQVAGSTLALGIARALLTSSDETVKRQLAANVFYIVPRLDADGTEAVFAPLQAPPAAT
jgi:murein tripeptide amidase MpaA